MKVRTYHCRCGTSVDKPAGRGKKLRSSAVKNYATENELHLLQPENLKSNEFISQLQNLNADIFVVVAFRMMPKSVVFTETRHFQPTCSRYCLNIEVQHQSIGPL